MINMILAWRTGDTEKERTYEYADDYCRDCGGGACRRLPSMIAAVLDVILRRGPKFLGPRELLPE